MQQWDQEDSSSKKAKGLVDRDFALLPLIGRGDVATRGWDGGPMALPDSRAIDPQFRHPAGDVESRLRPARRARFWGRTRRKKAALGRPHCKEVRRARGLIGEARKDVSRFSVPEIPSVPFAFAAETSCRQADRLLPKTTDL